MKLLHFMFVAVFLCTEYVNCKKTKEKNDPERVSTGGFSFLKNILNEVSELRAQIMEPPIEVSKKERDQITQLRQLIQKAVNEDESAVGSSIRNNTNEMLGGPAVPDESGTLRRNISRITGGFKANSPVGGQGEGPADKFKSVQPNLVESKVVLSFGNDGDESEGAFRQNVETNSLRDQVERGNREVLTLQSVVEDLSFDIGEQVSAWKTLIGPKGRLAVIGITPTGVTLALEKNGNYIFQQSIDLGGKPTCFDVFERWNFQKGDGEDIVVVSVNKKIVWIDVESSYEKMNIIWSWEINKVLTLISYFKMGNSDRLLFISESSNIDKTTTADLYQFDLSNRDFWLLQIITLQVPCNSVGILDTGRDYVLAFPELSTVDIYRYEVTENIDGKFVLYERIKTENVQAIAGFQMGGYSYLAVGGYNPQILRYHRGKFVAQTILARSWGLIEEWFPVSTRTYRDDLILLVQHRIHFATHSLSVIEALIWDGESFDTALAIPCHIDDIVVEFGLSCMLDFEREDGIKGATVVQRGTNISLLVPNENAPSGLFNLIWQLNSVKDPVQDEIERIEEMYTEILEMLEYESKVLADANEALKYALSENGGAVEAPWTVEKIETESFYHFSDDIFDNTEIVVGDRVWTKDEFNIDIPTLLESLERSMYQIEDWEKEMAIDIRIDSETTKPRNRRQNQDVSFGSLSVDNLNVKEINGIPVDEIVFVKDGILEVDGTLILEKPLVLTREEFRQASEPQEIKFEQMHSEGNIYFETINGVPWDELESKIIFTNVPIEIEDLNLNGALTSRNSTHIEELNGLKFPEDYLFINEPIVSNVSGLKEFNVLSSSEIDLEGPLNGRDMSDIITLSGKRFIPGLTTFNQLEVIESINVSGKVIGKNLDKFLSNPNLLQTTTVTSSCLFNELIVNGPIIVRGRLGEFNLDTMLSDVVYKSKGPVQINSIKTIGNMTANNLELSSNKINGIDLDAFISTDTDQLLKFNEVSGSIYFNSLQLGGLFNGINVTELDLNTIKLYGDQYTEAELIFQMVAEADNPYIEAFFLDVQGSINAMTKDDMIPLDGLTIIQADVSFSDLDVENLTIYGNFTGNEDDSINGVSLRKLDSMKLSLTEQQEINVPIHIENLVITTNLNAETLNGIDAVDLQEYLSTHNDVDGKIKSGMFSIDKLEIVNGNLNVNILNSYKFDTVIENAIWLNRPNNVSGTMKFLDDVTVKGNIKTSYFHGKPADEFFDSLLNRNEGHIQLTGTKVFHEPLKVMGNLNTINLNHHPVGNLFFKNYSGAIAGPLHVDGNLYVQELVVRGEVHSHNMENDFLIYDYDNELNAHVFRNNVVCKEPLITKNLQLRSLNDIENVDSFLDSIIRTDRPCNVTGKKEFTSIKCNQNLNVMEWNGINLPKLLNEVVFIDDPESVMEINSPIEFRDPVAAIKIHVTDELVTSNLNGCDLKEWMDNSLRIDEDLDYKSSIQFSPETFYPSSIQCDYLNGRAMSNIITLNRPQQLNGTIRILSATSEAPIEVTTLVNGFDLRIERKNTLMNYGTQTISSPIEFGKSFVSGNLTLLGMVNNIDLKDAATVFGDITIDGPVSFLNIETPTVETSGTITGKDFTQFYDKTLWHSGRDEQQITGNWSADSISFTDGVKGDMPFNDIDIKRSKNDEVVNAKLHREFQEFCYNAQDIAKTSQNSIYFFKYFDLLYTIQQSANVSSIFFFADRNSNYLLVNSNCQTDVFQWNQIGQQFQKISTTQTGYVETWLTVNDKNDQIHIISNSQHDYFNCKVSGCNLWEFDGQGIALELKLSSSGVYSSLRTNKYKPGFFLALRNNDSTVVEFDLLLVSNEEWNLPVGDRQYRFLPEEANLGLSLSDGKYLSVLNSVKHKRVQRCPNIANVRDLGTEFTPSKSSQLKGVVTTKLQEAINDTDLLRIAREFRNNATTSAPVNLSEIVENNVDEVPAVGVSQIEQKADRIDAKMKKAIAKLVHKLVENAKKKNQKKMEYYSGEDSEEYEDVNPYVVGLVRNITYARLQNETWSFHENATIVGDNSKFRSEDEEIEYRSKHKKYVKLVFDVVNEVMDLYDVYKKRGKKIHEDKDDNYGSYDDYHGNYYYKAADPMNPDMKASEFQLPIKEHGTNLQNKQESIAIKTELETPKHHNLTNQEETTNSSNSANDQVNSPQNVEVNDIMEPTIAQPIPMGGVITAGNEYFPHTQGEEVVVLQVGYGQRRRSLIAVSVYNENTVYGNYDSIKIFEDVLQGNIFQTIHTHRPRSLTALSMRDETLLCFLEGTATIQIFMYRGFQGFVRWDEFPMHAPVSSIVAVLLPGKEDYSCPSGFLVASIETDVWFFGAVMAGKCSIQVDLDCD